MGSHLFSPFTLRATTLANRIMVAPMCQYSAQDGTVGDWHLMHLGQFALAGPGLLVIEATGIEPEGRITPSCTGLYSDDNEAAFARVLSICRSVGGAKLGIQLNHAGRKGSTVAPWLGGGPIEGPQAWTPEAPSAIPYLEGWAPPAPSTPPAWRASAVPSPELPNEPPGSASTTSKSTPPTAISCISSFRRSPTGARMPTVARPRTGCAFRSSVSRPREMSSRRIGR